MTDSMPLMRKLWEPAVKYLLKEAESLEGGFWVKEVWCFEGVNHGDGALLNAEHLGDFCE